MRRVTAVLGAAMILLASAASAQKPDFSGTWTVDQDKTNAVNPAPQGGGAPGGRGMGMGMGGPMTLKLDAGSLTIERQGPNGAQSTVYKLDGSATTVSMGQREGTAKAMWEGNTIVIATTMEGPQGPITTKAVYALEGEYLVVANTRPGRDGEAMTRKTYYKKS